MTYAYARINPMHNSSLSTWQESYLCSLYVAVQITVIRLRI